MHIKKEMVDFVIQLLKNKIPETYYYHNVEHTLYVMNNVQVIGKAESCTHREIMLLKTAALWHDTGYIHIYKGHEEESCLLSRTYLPAYGYQETEIRNICGMIMATKVPNNPKNKLEEIIVDADLAYLGTSLAATLANNLFRELNKLNPQLDRPTWNKTEIEFLRTHHYYTNYCLKHRQPGKMAYLESLIKANG